MAAGARTPRSARDIGTNDRQGPIDDFLIYFYFFFTTAIIISNDNINVRRNVKNRYLLFILLSFLLQRTSDKTHSSSTRLSRIL